MPDFLSIQMVDLKRQYERLSKEIDSAISECLLNGQFIQGVPVQKFESELGEFISSKYTVSCGNGTDALMLACMALGLKRGDKVIVPAFTYIASVEILKILSLEPVFCDVSLDTFMPDVTHLETAYEESCKAVIIVHLYGQSAEMAPITEWAKGKGLFVIEDNAQSIGAECQIKEKSVFAGTIGDIGTTSFFPSKNLGAYGDGGAIFTQDEKLATQLRKIANHGQSKKYIHDFVGVNSRLDTIQAAVLRVKLKYLPEFIRKRKKVALFYDHELKNVSEVRTPAYNATSTHVFHQYTIRVKNRKIRDSLQDYLKNRAIPSVIYYPMPMYRQKPYFQDIYLPNTEALCHEVLSLPMHTEMTDGEMDYIINNIKGFFNVSG